MSATPRPSPRKRVAFRQRRLLLLALLLLAFAAAKLATLWWWQHNTPNTAPTPLSAPCDIRRACALAGGAHIRFSAQQRAQDPFDIRIDGLPAHTGRVYVQFSMSGMDMGFNRFELRRSGEGSWQATQIRLPLCIEQRHDYRVDVFVDGAPQRIAFTAP